MVIGFAILVPYCQEQDELLWKSKNNKIVLRQTMDW